MAKQILDDRLWALIEPHLPPPKPRRWRYPGRKPIGHRQTLTGILYVLITGIPWEWLPQEMGCGSGMTCWRRLAEWQRLGIWDKIHRILLGHLQAADRIDWSRAVVDSSAVRAVFGGTTPDRTPQIAANRARNTTSRRMRRGFRWQFASRRPIATT